MGERALQRRYGEYDRLEQARKIHPEAANSSAMHESELKQLILAARFIRQAGMLPALQTENWAEFARRYNGPAYAQNGYDKKLVEAYMGKKI